MRFVAAVVAVPILLFAWQLGAAAGEATLLARAMETLEPAQDSLYGTNDCRAGSRLDLHPGTPDFPTEHPTTAPRGAAVRAT
jgi:hypothetical protein